jgi:hypothetical protein
MPPGFALGNHKPTGKTRRDLDTGPAFIEKRSASDRDVGEVPQIDGAVAQVQPVGAISDRALRAASLPTTECGVASRGGLLVRDSLSRSTTNGVRRRLVRQPPTDPGTLRSVAVAAASHRYAVSAPLQLFTNAGASIARRRTPGPRPMRQQAALGSRRLRGHACSRAPRVSRFRSSERFVTRCRGRLIRAMQR